MSFVSFGGLASGLDTNALIDGLLAAERIPLAAMERRKGTLGTAQQTISSISSKLSALKSAAQALQTPAGYSSFKISSPEGSGIAASVNGGASPGSFDITVSQLAKEQRTYSNIQTGNTTALGMTGTLQLQVGAGAPVDLTIDPADTLTDIASKIGSSGLRVGAAVIFDGTGYRLQVRGLDTGAANNIQMTQTGFDLGLNEVVNQKQTAQDALLEIDGIPITRSTNQVSGVIPGVTLAITKEIATPQNIQITQDPDNLKTKIGAFISAYNDVMSAGQLAAGFGTIKANNAELAGDSAIRSTLARLGSTLGKLIPGTTGKYQTLGSIGIEADKDGKIKLNDVKFSAALGADPTAISKLFVEDATVGSTGAMKGFMTMVDQLATDSNAIIKTRSESLTSLSKRLDDDAAAMERRLSLFETSLRQRFTQLEILMSSIKSQGNALSGIVNSQGYS